MCYTETKTVHEKKYKLEGLTRSDRAYARTMLMWREKAWNQFCWLQELNEGDVIKMPNEIIALVTRIEDTPADFYDIRVWIRFGKSSYCTYAMKLKYAQLGDDVHKLYMEYHQDKMAYTEDALKLSKATDMEKVLFSDGNKIYEDPK